MHALSQDLPRTGEIGENQLSMMNVLLFDEFMSSVIKIISKLDLSSKSVEENETSAAVRDACIVQDRVVSMVMEPHLSLLCCGQYL